MLALNTFFNGCIICTNMLILLVYILFVFKGTLMDKKTYKKILLAISYAVLLLALVFRFESIRDIVEIFFGIIQPVIIGLCIAFVLSRPAGFFEDTLRKLFKGKHHSLTVGLSIFAVYLLLIIIVLALFGMVIPSLADSLATFIGNLEIYAANLEDLIATLPPELIPNFLNSDFFTDITENIGSIIQSFLTGVFPQIFTITSTLGSAISSTFFGIILSIYIVAERHHLASQATRLVKAYAPVKIQSGVFKISKISNFVFTKYVVGQLSEALILGLLCFIGMSILGFEYAMLISVIIGVTNVIPIVGPIVGSIPSAFILLMVDPASALWFILFIIILQQLESNLIYPRVVGGSVGLPGPYVLSGVLIGGGMFGAVGMLLALPVLSVIYQLVKINVEDKEAVVESLKKDQKNL